MHKTVIDIELFCKWYSIFVFAISLQNRILLREGGENPEEHLARVVKKCLHLPLQHLINWTGASKTPNLPRKYRLRDSYLVGYFKVSTMSLHPKCSEDTIEKFLQKHFQETYSRLRTAVLISILFLFL